MGEIGALAYEASGSEGATLFEPPELRPEPAIRHKRSANRIRFYYESNSDVFVKAVDSTGTMLGVAQWRLPGKTAGDPPKKAEADKTDEDRAAESALNQDFGTRFGAAVKEARERTIGDTPVYYLKLLVVHPEHMRKGVGAAVSGPANNLRL